MFISKKKFERMLDEKWQEGWMAGRKRGQECVRYDGIIIRDLLAKFSQVIDMIKTLAGLRKKEERIIASEEITKKIKQIAKLINERVSE